MSFFKASLCNRTRKIQFIWSWWHERRKIAWVAWDKVCSPIETGGLWTRDVGRFNMTLLVKWKWKIKVETEGEWRDILDSKYGLWRDMKFIMVDRNYEVWIRIWIRIRYGHRHIDITKLKMTGYGNMTIYTVSYTHLTLPTKRIV